MQRQSPAYFAVAHEIQTDLCFAEYAGYRYYYIAVIYC